MEKYDLTLHGKNEFTPGLNHKKYFIYKIDTKEKEQFMINKSNEYIHNNFYLGIDFEFNKISKGEREVALMQMNIENDSDIAFIFLFNPTKLKYKNEIIKILIHKNGTKILHGSESLDIPYLFNQLLKTKENVELFCNNFYDTKYLCDYDNILNEEKKKCSIYNLLLNNKIINDNILNKLEKNEEVLGPIYLVDININNMNEQILNYCLYDVIYLPELLKIFLKKDDIYKKVIPEITYIVNKYKRNIETEFLELEKIVNTFNLYYVKFNNEKIFLKDLWEMAFLILKNPLDQLKEINYFKHFFEIVTKFFLYYHFTNSIKLKFNFFNNWLKKYNHIYHFLQDFYNSL